MMLFPFLGVSCPVCRPAAWSGLLLATKQQGTWILSGAGWVRSLPLPLYIHTHHTDFEGVLLLVIWLRL